MITGWSCCGPDHKQYGRVAITAPCICRVSRYRAGRARPSSFSGPSKLAGTHAQSSWIFFAARAVPLLARSSRSYPQNPRVASPHPASYDVLEEEMTRGEREVVKAILAGDTTPRGPFSRLGWIGDAFGWMQEILGNSIKFTGRFSNTTRRATKQP